MPASVSSIEQHPTIEVIYTSNGSGQLQGGKPHVERIVCWLHRPNNEVWAKTESGDIFPVKRHDKQHVATFFAIPR